MYVHRLLADGSLLPAFGSKGAKGVKWTAQCSQASEHRAGKKCWSHFDRRAWTSPYLPGGPHASHSGAPDFCAFLFGKAEHTNAACLTCHSLPCCRDGFERLCKPFAAAFQRLISMKRSLVSASEAQKAHRLTLFSQGPRSVCLDNRGAFFAAQQSTPF